MGTPSSTAGEVIRCARKLIVAGGYDSFSYKDISGIVGIRNASIHHHFPTKADLVLALAVAVRKEYGEGIAALERSVTTPVGQLRAYVTHWESCITDESAPLCVFALLGAQVPVLPEPVALEVRAHFRFLSAWLASVLERGLEQRSIRLSGTAREEAELFLATIHGAMISARAYQDTKIFGAVVHQLLQRLVA